MYVGVVFATTHSKSLDLSSLFNNGMVVHIINFSGEFCLNGYIEVESDYMNWI